jgi:ribosomal protein L3 glutamine methyltransferase
MTLGEVIDAGAERFAQAQLALGQGTLEFRDEARWLALAALALPVESPQSLETLTLDPVQAKAIEGFFKRRIDERLPAAYITGTAWLKGYAFRVDPRVIIPRSFIAELLLEKLSPFIHQADAVRDVLDLCTGSGCLAIIAADQFPNAKVVASDLSFEALEVAAENVSLHRLKNRIALIQGDVYAGLHTSQTFDLIVCNPPYVPKTKAAKMPLEFQQEPPMALYAESQGMAIVREVLAGAAQRLKPQGILVMEIGHEFAACQAMLAKYFPGIFPTWIESPEQIDNVFVVTREELLLPTRRPSP